MKSLKTLPKFIMVIVLLAACHDQVPEDQIIPVPDPQPANIYVDDSFAPANGRTSSGEGIVLYMAEYLTNGEDGAMGNTVFFNDRGNKQLSSDFVPGDPRAGGATNILWAVDNFDGAATNSGAGLTATQTEAAIDRAMDTWEGVNCSDLGLAKVNLNPAVNFGQVADFFTNPGFPGFFAPGAHLVLHAGFLPGSFFDLIAPGGSQFILGVTFTLVFLDGSGNLSDIDNNGKTDVAIKEIYYNDNFNWNDGSNFDVETVALHEAGHGLSQAHFGKAFLSGGNGKLHFAPRAVMNAAYSGVQTDIRKTDNAGHCSNWAEWPNN